MGADKIVLLLTKPAQIPREPGKDALLAKLIRRKYPRVSEGMRLRAERYNAGVQQARALEKEGRALIVSPDDTCGVDTLTRDADNMKRFYEKGVGDAAQIEAYLRSEAKR